MRPGEVIVVDRWRDGEPEPWWYDRLVAAQLRLEIPAEGAAAEVPDLDARGLVFLTLLLAALGIARIRGASSST